MIRAAAITGSAVAALLSAAQAEESTHFVLRTEPGLEPFILMKAEYPGIVQPPAYFLASRPAGATAAAERAIRVQIAAAPPAAAPAPSLSPLRRNEKTAGAIAPDAAIHLAAVHMAPARVEASAADAAQSSSSRELEHWFASAEKDGFAKIEETLMGGAEEREGARQLIFFYMAHGLWPEALAIIREQTNPSDELRFLEGVANYQMGRWTDAAEILADDGLRDLDAAAAWRGLAHAKLGAYEAAAGDLFAAAPPSGPFEHNAADFFLAAANVALERGKPKRARAALENLRGRDLANDQRAERRLIEARLMLAEGGRERARGLLEALTDSGSRPAANRARMELMRDRLATGEIDADAALANVEALYLTWSGGAFEREALAFKAALCDRTGDAAEAFRARRRLIETFPEADAARQAEREMTQRLSTLFDQADLSPMIAAEIFYENIDAAPPGRAGDALIRHVAERLAALDLLKQAAELLRHQVFNRLRGPSRSHTAAELAAIYLADDRPQEALETLRATRLARLPAALNDRRRILEARALVDTGETDAALALVSADESEAGLRLRGDIHWTAKEWRKAGAAYAASLSSSGDAARSIDGGAARAALRAAAAFVLAGDVETLSAFEEKIKGRLADENLKVLLATLAGDGAEADPAEFLAAYERYFETSGGS